MKKLCIIIVVLGIIAAVCGCQAPQATSEKHQTTQTQTVESEEIVVE